VRSSRCGLPWNFFSEKTVTALTLDVFPPLPDESSNFTLYEDDGLTRDYASGAFAKQLFEVSVQATGSTSVRIGKSEGSYDQKPSHRNYTVQIHSDIGMADVMMMGLLIPQHKSLAQLDAAPNGWVQINGRIDIKTGPLSLSHAATLFLRSSQHEPYIAFV